RMTSGCSITANSQPLSLSRAARTSKPPSSSRRVLSMDRLSWSWSEGGVEDGIFAATDCGAVWAVPLGHAGASQGSHAGARGSGDRDAGARALGARHRRCLQGREWPAVVIEDLGVAAWGAAVGGLPGVRAAGLERVRDHVSVCRWHRRAVAAWRQTRAGAGGLGLYDRGPPRAVAHDGGLQGGHRDGDRVL